MRRTAVPCLLFLFCVWQLAGAQPVQNLTSNNTSACVPGSSKSAAPCSTTFGGMTDVRAGLATPTYNVQPFSNISTASMTQLLYPGSQSRSTKIYAHFMGHFVAPGTTQGAPGILVCPSPTGYLTTVALTGAQSYKCPENTTTNPITGDNAITFYATALQATVQKQLADVTRRGFDGVTIDWYAGPSTSEEVIADLVRDQFPAVNPSGKYAIAYNGTR